MKKQILSLLFSFGFLCSFFVVQAAGELSPVQPGRGYLADGTDDYVLYDNFDGSMIGNEVTFQYRYEGVHSAKGIWGATDAEGYRYDVYLSTATQVRIFVKGSGSSQYYHYAVPSFVQDNIYDFEVVWTAESTAPSLLLNGTSYSGTLGSTSSLSATLSKYYLYTIGAAVGGASYAGRAGISDVQVRRSSDGKLLHSWHLDEGSGTTSFDSVREWQGTELATNGIALTDSNSDGLADAFSRLANKGDVSIVTGNGFPGRAQRMEWNATAAGPQSLGVLDILQSGKKYRIKFYYRTNVATYVSDSNHYTVATPIAINTGNAILFDKEFLYVGVNNDVFFTSWLDAAGEWAEIGNISIQELHEPAHGTITNATPATFHTTDTNFKSYQNEVGYSENAHTTTNTLQSSNLINYNMDSFHSDDNVSATWEHGDYSGTKICGTADEIPLIAGEKYIIEFNAEYTGSNPNLVFALALGSSFASPANVISNGFNSIELVPTTTTTGVLQFYSVSLSSVSITDLTIFKLSPEGVLIPVALDQNGNATTQDIYGNDATYTGRTRTKTKLVGKNVAVFDGVDDYVEIADNNNFEPDTVTVSAWVKGVPSSFDAIVTYGAWSGDYTLWFNNTDIPDFRIDNNVAAASTNCRDNKWHHLVGTYDKQNIKIYVDGVLEGTQAYTADINYTGSSVAIGRSVEPTLAHLWKGSISDVNIYNRALSATEVADLYNGEQVTSGLIASYPLSEGAGTTVYDTVPTWYGEDLVTNGEFTTDSGWTKGTGWTISGGKAHCDGTQTTVSYLYQVNGIVVGKKYKVVFTISDYSAGNVRLRLGNSATTPGIGVYRNANGVYTEVLYGSGTGGHFWFEADTNFIGSIDTVSVQEVHEPANGTVTNADLDTFWATDMSAEDQNLVNGYTPGLLNTTAGTAYKENTQAYGVWEFDLNKGSEGNEIGLVLMNQSSNPVTFFAGNYSFSFRNNEAIQILKDGSILFSTAISYISNNTWYRIKIQRNQTLNQYHTGAVGSFAVYIKGGAFGDEYVLVSTAGGSGTNPVTDNTYTTSAYSVVDLDAGDQVAGFMANNKILDFHSFTEGTGAYDKLSLPAQSGRTAKDINNDRLTYMPQNLRNSAMAYKNVGVFDGVDDYVDAGNSTELNITDVISISAWVKATSATPSYDGIVNKATDNSWDDGYCLFYNDNKFQFYVGDYQKAATITAETNTWVHLVGTFDGTTTKIYKNGIGGTPYSYTGSILTTSNNLFIGTGAGPSSNPFYYFPGKIVDVRIYNRALSAADVQKLYQGETINNNGLVAHYPLSEGAGTTAYNAAPTWYGSNRITDGNGNWGDTDGNGLGEAWMTHRPANQFSILTDSYGRYQHVVKNTENLCSLAQSNVVQTEGGRTYKLTLKYRSDSNISDGTGGYDYDIIPFSTTPVTVERIISGGTGGLTTLNFFSGGTYMDIYSVTLQEIHEPTHGTLTNTTPATFWQIDNTASFSQSYRDGFSQGLVNTTAGTAYTPSDVAYGEWEFDVKKQLDANGMRIPMINTNTSSDTAMIGYQVNLSDQERVVLQKSNGSLLENIMFTNTSYISLNTWYRIKVTRSTAGVFTVYIRGGAFGDDYVLVSTAGGSGTNPVTDTTYTTSNYFVADLDAGDQIANVQIDGHRASVHEFELGTGKYDKLFIPAQTGRGMDVLGNVLQIIGLRSGGIFTATDLAYIAAQKIARAGIHYWDVTTKKFFIGREDGSLADLVPNMTRVKTTAELATINTNKTADEGYNYWDTTLRKFLRGLADGSLQNFQSWFWSGKCPETVRDGAGNIYDTVKIGDQCWMKQHLNFGTKVDDPGSAAIAAACAGNAGTYQVIGGVECHCTSETYASCQQGGVTKKYCYANDEANCTANGALYEWHEAMNLPANCAYTDCSAQINTPHQGICPRGWHIPTDAELKALEGYLGMSVAQQDTTGWRGTDEGDKLKTVDKCTGGVNCNSSEFSAVLAGYRNVAGGFLYSGSIADVWSASQSSSSTAWRRFLYSGYSTVYRNASNKSLGFSLRCVQD